MSPFKEPQPRKNSVEKDGEKVIGGNWPPYERTGSEARWEDEAKASLRARVDPEDASDEMRDWAPGQSPILLTPDYSRFEVRKAALEASVRYFGDGSRSKSEVLDLANSFEDYLRNGKPS